jgi:hypothetical protein
MRLLLGISNFDRRMSHACSCVRCHSANCKSRALRCPHPFVGNALRPFQQNQTSWGTPEAAPIATSDNNLAAHYLALEMGGGIVLTGRAVVILRHRLMWCQFFQPDLIVAQGPTLRVVHEGRGANVHGKQIPSLTPLFLASRSIIAVMFRKPRRFGTANHRYSASDLIPFASFLGQPFATGRVTLKGCFRSVNRAFVLNSEFSGHAKQFWRAIDTCQY